MSRKLPYRDLPTYEMLFRQLRPGESLLVTWWRPCSKEGPELIVDTARGFDHCLNLYRSGRNLHSLQFFAVAEWVARELRRWQRISL